MGISIRLAQALKILGHDPLLLIAMFGACPECRSIDGFIQRGKSLVVYCHQHQVKWRSPANLLHATRHSPPVRIADSTDAVREYEWVKPYRPATED